MIISNFDKNLSWVKILRFKALLITIISLHMSSVMLGQVIYNVCPQGTLTNSLKGAIVDIHQKLLNSSERDYVVVLDDGIYFLDEPLVFEGNDILPDHSISFIAKDGTNPIISGGEKIINWEVDYSCISGNNILRASVNNDVRNLWINNTRMKRSQGFVGYATGTFEDTIDGIEIRGLLFPKANFPNFSDVSGLEIKYYQNWRNYFFKVTDILDNKSISTIPENQILVVIKDFNVALEMTPKMIYVGTDNPYYFENSIDLLDEPGEWCYSPKEHSIFYYAGNNENLKNINAIVPKLQNLISIKSLSLENVRKNLVFSGLEFSHTNWNRTSENGFFPKQGSTFCPTYNDRDVIPAAIVVQDAKNVKFKSCYFLHLGSNGIHIKNNVDSLNVENCFFSDLSGTAVCISDPYHKTYSDTILPVKNINIKNNYVKGIGEEYASCPSIEAYFCEDLTIANNDLYDLPYSAISVGWGWTTHETTQKNIKILNNKIIGDTQKCSDGGAIYSLSNFGGDGLLIEGNYIDEVSNKPCVNSQGAIYTDEGSSNVRINNNVVITDRNWFFHHWAGSVEVDSVFVLVENRDKYGGINIPSGESDINYVENGEHIFCMPHDRAEDIIKHAGIDNDYNVSGVFSPLSEKEENYFDLDFTYDGLKITFRNDVYERTKVNIYSIEGYLKKSYCLENGCHIILDRNVKGYNIVEILSNNYRRIIPLKF